MRWARASRKHFVNIGCKYILRSISLLKEPPPDKPPPQFPQLHVACSRGALRRVSLSGCRGLTTNGLANFLSATSSLLHLDLSGCPRVNDVVALALATSLSSSSHEANLLHLDLSGCSVTISDRAITALAQACPRLSFVSLGGLNRLTDSAIVSLVALRALEVLCLRGCERVRLRFLGRIAPP